MANDVTFGFDSTDPQDGKWIDRIVEYKKARASGVPTGLVEKIKRAKVGRVFVKPVAQAMTPGQHYTAAGLGQLINEPINIVCSRLRVLGRPESRAGRRIFDRPADGVYSISAEMRDAILAP